MIGIHLTYDCDGDPYDRLREVAALCAAGGHHYVAEEITLGLMLGLSPEDQVKIGTARELYVFDCVFPNGWAVTIVPWFDLDDESTYWTYSTDDLSVVEFGAGGAP